VSRTFYSEARPSSGLQVAQADAAELERRRDHALPEAGQVGDDAQLDVGLGVPREQVAELDHLERFDATRETA
jgi:hypothetical protein